MEIYVGNVPETISVSSVEDDVNIKEVRLWFRTNENIDILSLDEYRKQVRKEACEEIRNKLKENGLLYTWKREPKYKTMEEILDQTQGENNESNN